MTAIAALVCRDGIVIASDSETTEQDMVRRDAEKITVLAMESSQVLVAESGNAESSRTAIEFLDKLAKHSKLDDYRKVADMGSEAMLACKREIASHSYHCKMERLNDLIRRDGLDCTLMICHFFNENPFIFTGDLLSGKFVMRPFAHWSIGIGKHITQYILNRLYQPDCDLREAVRVAAYAVGEAKQSVPGCDGPTRIATITRRNQGTALKPNHCADIEKEVLKLASEHNLSWGNLVTQIGVEAAKSPPVSEWQPAY